MCSGPPDIRPGMPCEATPRVARPGPGPGVHELSKSGGGFRIPRGMSVETPDGPRKRGVGSTVKGGRDGSRLGPRPSLECCRNNAVCVRRPRSNRPSMVRMGASSALFRARPPHRFLSARRSVPRSVPAAEQDSGASEWSRRRRSSDSERDDIGGLVQQVSPRRRRGGAAAPSQARALTRSK